MTWIDWAIVACAVYAALLSTLVAILVASAWLRLRDVPIPQQRRPVDVNSVFDEDGEPLYWEIGADDFESADTPHPADVEAYESSPKTRQSAKRHGFLKAQRFWSAAAVDEQQDRGEEFGVDLSEEFEDWLRVAIGVSDPCGSGLEVGDDSEPVVDPEIKVSDPACLSRQALAVAAYGMDVSDSQPDPPLKPDTQKKC